MAIKEQKWWDSPQNIAGLAAWMADRGDSARDVAYMVEKPWKFESDWYNFQRELELSLEREKS